MNVLVTGSAGFIASKVCESLLADGHTLVGIDNLNDAYDIRLKEWRLAQLKRKPGLEFHQLDICDRPALRQLFKRYAIDQPTQQHSKLNKQIKHILWHGPVQCEMTPHFGASIIGYK